MVNSYNSKRDGLLARSQDIEILNFGNSQADCGIDPGQFSRSAYNLANSSQSLVIDYQLYEKYVDRLPKLKALLIPISHFSLGYQLDTGKEYWRNFYYTHFHQISGDIRWRDKFDVRLFSLYFLYGPPLSITSWKNGFVSHLVTPFGREGWNRREGKPEEFVDTSPETVPRHEKLITAMGRSVIEPMLRNWAKTASNRNLKFVFVTLPVDTSYTEKQSPEIVQQNRQFLESVVASVPGVSYYDYARDPRFQHEHFLNSDHLNATGAQLFSKILNAEAVSPLFNTDTSPVGKLR